MGYVKVNNVGKFKIKLPNGKETMLWFSGSQLEEVLKAYNIPYKRLKG